MKTEIVDSIITLPVKDPSLVGPRSFYQAIATCEKLVTSGTVSFFEIETTPGQCRIPCRASIHSKSIQHDGKSSTLSTDARPVDVEGAGATCSKTNQLWRESLQRQRRQ